MPISHLYKKPEAPAHANAACGYMETALELLKHAESEATLSGYRGAAHGIHQAAARVRDWLGKVDKELKPGQRTGPAMRLPPLQVQKG